MELKHIKETSCPVCGCNIIKSEAVELDRFSDKAKVLKHTNGQQWEHRTFACGQRLSWIPNFGKWELSDSYICKQNPEYIAKIQKREKAKELVSKYIKTLENVDEEFKERMMREITTLWV